MVTRDDIKKGLVELGVEAGDAVVVHSSLSSFGRVDGGADTVVDALLEVLGEEGTLIVPTFNYSPGVFDPEQTPSLVGKITEAVRARPSAVRSLHPTHSVTAIGRLANVVTDGHEKTHAFARGSALFNALQADAKILQLGTTHISNSMIHVAEELVEVPYLDRQRQVTIRTARGRTVTKWIRRPGCSRGFGKIEEPLQERGAIRQTKIGDCVARLMSARAVVDAAVEMLEFDPEALLCNRPDCDVCAESRAIISATRTQQQDRETIELHKREERSIRRIQRRLGVSEITGPESGGSYHSQN